MFLKQSTAVTVKVGPFVDSTDGNTEETALTISQADIRLSKNGGAFAQTNNAAGATHDEKGWYGVPLDATDTNTIGKLELHIHESGALPVWRTFFVLVANVFDSLFGAGTDKLDVNVEEWNTTAVPAEHTAGYPIVTIKDGTGTGEINTNAGAVALVDLVTTLTTYTGNTPQTGDSFARLGAPAGASVSADIAAIEAQTDDIGAAGAGLTAVPWNAAWDAEVQSEVEDALVVHRLDELLNADSDIDGAAPPTVGSVFHELMSKTAGSFTFDQTTDSCEAIRDRGDAAWTTATGFSTHSAADVWAVATRVLTAATNITDTGGTLNVDGSGNVHLANGAHGGAAAVLTLERIIVASATTNEPAVKLTGDGSGAGLLSTGGSSGHGIVGAGNATTGSGLRGTGAIGASFVGAGSSGASFHGLTRGIYVTTDGGDGIVLAPTAGHGFNTTGNGTDKHGFVTTGGTAGTSDGLKAVAGTGGVPIRGDITGNITGTLATLTTYTGNTPQTGDSFARLGAPAGASVSADIAAVQADLPSRITKNTALAAFPFWMQSATDHVSGATGLTITATRSIDGGAFAACANSASEIGNGWYKIDLAASDLNGDTIAFKFTATGADQRPITVVTERT